MVSKAAFPPAYCEEETFAKTLQYENHCWFLKGRNESLSFWNKLRMAQKYQQHGLHAKVLAFKDIYVGVGVERERISFV